MKLSYLSFNKIDFSLAIPYTLAQIGGGALAGFLIDKHLTPNLHEKLA